MGAVYEWNGNRDIGQGRRAITESPPAGIVLSIDFIKPFAAHNTEEFTLATQADTTTVMQAMYGPNTYLSKIVGIFFSMDEMIDQIYEAGLTNLKAIAEK